MFKSQHIICILWITVGLLAMSLTVQSGPVNENEIVKGRECKAFCGSCGCIGFYCGEECICECNEEKNDDTECIASIQANAEKRKVPFEILIQGPSANRFLKNALQFDQNQQQCSKGDSGRMKRSTVVIYKPATANSLDENGYCKRPLEKSTELSKKQLFRGKRAIDNDSWFTDFSNTLVQPAPIPGKTIESESVMDQEEAPIEVNETESGEEFLPKVRGKIRKISNIRDRSEIVKGIRKGVKKIESNALRVSELDGTAKKIRGAISTLRNRAEEILLPPAEATESGESKSAGRRLLNKLRGNFFRSFGEEEPIDVSIS